MTRATARDRLQNVVRRPSYLAYEGEVNRTYMSKIEKGATWVGLEIIGKVAAVLEVEPAELLRLPVRRPRRKQAME